MNERKIAVRLSGVKKMYKLGQIGTGTLTRDLQSWWAKIRGKEDPNSTIGSQQRLVGQTFMALNGIDLTVYQGEALGIIGGNGAGKSTMLKLLSRVTAPTDGQICINGRIASMLEVGTGFNPEMTGRENVYMNGTILGMSKTEVDAKMAEIIEFSEVGDFIDTPVKRYSSGMYVKLAFSVAAHLDSEIMIMDEVLAVGDMAFQKKCLDKMRDAAQKEGRTILYVSHNMNTIRQLCDRCIVLDKGKIIFEGDVEKAIDIYMDNKRQDATKLYCSDTERPNWIALQRMKLSLVEYLGKEDIVFKDDEPIVIHFCWENLLDVEDLGLLLEVCSMDDVAQASYVVYNVYSGKKGEKAELTLQLDASRFMDATYRMRYTFFNKNPFGEGRCIEALIGLCFTKETTNRGDTLIWHPKQWGYLQMPTPKVISAGSPIERRDRPNGI